MGDLRSTLQKPILLTPAPPSIPLLTRLNYGGKIRLFKNYSKVPRGAQPLISKIS